MPRPPGAAVLHFHFTCDVLLMLSFTCVVLLVPSLGRIAVGLAPSPRAGGFVGVFVVPSISTTENITGDGEHVYYLAHRFSLRGHAVLSLPPGRCRVRLRAVYGVTSTGMFTAPVKARGVVSPIFGFRRCRYYAVGAASGSGWHGR